MYKDLREEKLYDRPHDPAMDENCQALAVYVFMLMSAD